VFDIEQAFLAPWAALLTVHATVYRTLRRGVQQVGATVLGVLVAFALGSVFGLNALSLGLAILIGLIAGSVRGLRAETTTAAATALVVLTTGASDDPSMLLSRLLDTGHRHRRRPARQPARVAAAARPQRCHQIDALDDRIGSCCPRWPRAATRRCGSRARARSTTTSTAPGASCARRARAAG
jgi:hypothetical protein